MSNRRDAREIQKQQPVTSRCLAIVLAPVTESDERNTENVSEINGKEILDEFKLRNKTCYWNPALIESIEKLEYLGFVHPCTILVKSTDLHLENLRTAWARRVLHSPANYKIERIGDVNGIEMEVIPQTQFIPLPEILCLIIMDLNNKQVIATLDVVHEQLKQCYRGMSIPSPQLTYDTLGGLIRERKVFHTGSGYFVVTPDTYRLPEDPTKTLPLPWLHYNPMYIPVLNQNRNLMRSISCQVTLVDEPQKVKDTDKVDCVNQEMCTQTTSQHTSTEKPRLGRSLSARRVKDKGSVKDVEGSDLKRSLSVRGKSEKEKPTEDVNLAKSNINKNKDKGDKKSLISKIFGRKKKSQVPKEPVKEVECATFSAQFPPPEWTWYREQMDKQQRIQRWVQQVPPKHAYGQISNEASYGMHRHHHGLPDRYAAQPHGRIHTMPNKRADDYEEIDDIDLDPNVRSTKPAPCSRQEQYDQRRMSDGRIRRREHKSHRRSLDRKTTEQIYQNVHLDQGGHVLPGFNTHFESPSLPYHPDSVLTQNQTTHPLYSSTPRTGPGMSFMEAQPRLNPHCEQVETKAQGPGNPLEEHRVHSHHRHKSSKSKRKSHRHHDYPPAANDITTEYFGRMPRKDSSFAMSCDSGVNCVGLGHAAARQNRQRREHVPKSIKEVDAKQNNVKLQNDTESHRHDTAEKGAKNQIVCEAEINPCVERTGNEYVTMEVVKKEEDIATSNPDSLHLESLMGSDVSYGTVVDKNKDNNSNKKGIELVTKEAEDLTLGDSGFCSPRVVEGQSPPSDNREIQNRVEKIKKASNSSLCPKNVYQRSDDGSHHSDCELPAHDKENKHKVLNNLKSLPHERSVLTHYNHVQHYTSNSNVEPKFLHQIPFKFNFDDDYEVVGVV